jgi:hypothetical protein
MRHIECPVDSSHLICRRKSMKFLCLAYGGERDWKALTKEQQETLLKQDEMLRERGALMAAVKTDVVTVTAWEGSPKVTDGAFTHLKVPLAGFSVIEATDIDEVVRLVAKTPCAQAKGAIEIRPILAINDFVLSGH